MDFRRSKAFKIRTKLFRFRTFGLKSPVWNWDRSRTFEIRTCSNFGALLYSITNIKLVIRILPDFECYQSLIHILFIFRAAFKTDIPERNEFFFPGQKFIYTLQLCTVERRNPNVFGFQTGDICPIPKPFGYFGTV